MTVLSVSSNWKNLSSKIKQQPKNAEAASKKEEDVWFDVDDKDMMRSRVEKIAAQTGRQVQPIDLFPKPPKDELHVGKYLAVDCEMVGVGPEGAISALARVSLVNFYGQVVIDKYVRPVERIVDFRTEFSGIRPHHMKDAVTLREVQEDICGLLDGKILVGHSLINDFKVLMINHPRKLTRDTSKFRPFRAIARGKNPSLKRLAEKFLGLKIQEGEHDSVDDARVAMLLYRSHKDQWENYLFRQEGKTFQQKKRSRKNTTKSSE